MNQPVSAREEGLGLELLPGTYAVCRLPVGVALPEWARGAFYSVTVTPSELSVVCEAVSVAAEVPHEPGWRCLKVGGTLDFSLTGILASLAVPLAEAGVSLFSLSTFDTDYVLVKIDRLEAAVVALEGAGHTVRELE